MCVFCFVFLRDKHFKAQHAPVSLVGEINHCVSTVLKIYWFKMSAQYVLVSPIKRTSCESARSLKDLMSLCTDRAVQAYLIACARADLCAMNTIDRGGGVSRRRGRGGRMNRRNSKRLPSSKLLSKPSKSSQWGGGRESSYSSNSQTVRLRTCSVHALSTKSEE